MSESAIHERTTTVAGQPVKLYSRDRRLWASTIEEHDEAWRVVLERLSDPDTFRTTMIPAHRRRKPRKR